VSNGPTPGRPSEGTTITATPEHAQTIGPTSLADHAPISGTVSSAANNGHSTHLDICLVSPESDRLQALIHYFEGLDHRTTLTSPQRMPSGTEWESYDIVLLDSGDRDEYPRIPTRAIHHLICLCDNEDLNQPAILRAALRAGALDLLPRQPIGKLWQETLGKAKTEAPDACLRFVDPKSSVERQITIGESLSIGRDSQHDASFPHPFVSRSHARIDRTGSRYRIVDGDSRHGTFVNGDRIREHVLTDGDRVQLGGVHGPVLTFNLVLMTEHTLKFLESTGFFDVESVNREIHDLSVLLETFLSLNSDLLLDEILELVVKRAIEFVHADRGAIFLGPDFGVKDGKPIPDSRPVAADTISIATALDRNGIVIDADQFDVRMRIPHQVLKTGVGLSFEDDDQADAFYSGRSSFPTNSEELSSSASENSKPPEKSSGMCVPLKVRRKYLDSQTQSSVIGVLYVDSTSRNRPFPPRMLDALEVLASEVATAIYTTRLYEDSLKNRRREEEMEIARQIQENIFHDQHHCGPAWEFFGSTRPSQEVGGDLLSTFAVDESRHAVLVGDVSGKGVPAALFSTMLDGAFYGVACSQQENRELGSSVEELNRFLLTRSRLRKFVTSIFAILDPDGAFHFVNAGHNPGLVLRKDGSRAELGACGTVLGMFDDSQYKSQTLALEPGDVVVLYSDGITESRNPEDQEFGPEKLEQVTRALCDTPARAIHDRILETFREFLDGNEPLDDLTLMVIKKR
jgi:sigma-B regulation protein RsbU (phosphoserine phosphatase)